VVRSPRALAVAYGIPIAISIVLGAGSATRLLPIDRLEAFGFITGAWGVWLQVRENVWNWPIQLVSSALYVVVFLNARLFSDASLNVLYVVLYALGFYWWLRGGEDHGELHIARVTPGRRCCWRP
jgi:nicotinamide riboside transporter PnuC